MTWWAGPRRDPRGRGGEGEPCVSEGDKIREHVRVGGCERRARGVPDSSDGAFQGRCSPCLLSIISPLINNGSQRTALSSDRKSYRLPCKKKKRRVMPCSGGLIAGVYICERGAVHNRTKKREEGDVSPVKGALHGS